MNELLTRFAFQNGLDALQTAALPTVAEVLTKNGFSAEDVFIQALSSPNPALTFELRRLATVGAMELASELIQNATEEPISLEVENVGEFFLATEFWDCNCDESYIHRKGSPSTCERCKSSEEDCPDSRLLEVLQTIYNEGRFIFYERDADGNATEVAEATIRATHAGYLARISEESSKPIRSMTPGGPLTPNELHKRLAVEALGDTVHQFSEEFTPQARAYQILTPNEAHELRRRTDYAEHAEDHDAGL